PALLGVAGNRLAERPGSSGRCLGIRAIAIPVPLVGPLPEFVVREPLRRPTHQHKPLLARTCSASPAVGSNNTTISEVDTCKKQAYRSFHEAIRAGMRHR